MVHVLFDGLREQLVAGDRIEIRGFGTLLLKDTKPKPGARNPRTGQPVPAPARRRTHFKPGLVLKRGMRRARPGRQAR